MYNKYCFKDFVIDEDLYFFADKYGDKEETDIRKKVDSAIKNSKEVIPELYDESREYPPFLYYTIIAMLFRSEKRKRWIDMTKPEKEQAVKEVYEWLGKLKDEIRTPTKEELKELGDKISIKVN